MAITITSTPNTINAVYGVGLKWTATSNASGIARMIADVYVAGVYQTTIAKDPDLGTTTQFTFDVASRLRTFLSGDFQSSYSGLQVIASTNSSKQVHLRLFEVTEIAGVFTTTWAEDGAGTGYTSTSAVSAVLSALNPTQTFSNYTQANTSKKFLTYLPDYAPILRTADFQIDFVNDGDLGAIIGEYDANQSPIISTNIAVPILTNRKGIVKIDMSSLQTNTAYITVQLRTGEGLLRSVEKWYKLVDDCDTDTKVLYWRNSLGGYEHFHFGSRVSSKNQSKYETYEKYLSDGYSLTDRGEELLIVESEEYYECISKPIGRDMFIALSQLVKNPFDAYVYENGSYRSIVIDVENTTKENFDNFKGLKQFKVVYRYSIKPVSQHG